MIYLIKKLSLSFDANVFDKLENLKETYLTHSKQYIKQKGICSELQTYKEHNSS